MSHFSVVVAIPGDVAFGDVKAAVSKALQPFHEFECTGEADEYVLDVNITDKARKEWDGREEHKDESFAKWVAGYYGLKTIRSAESPDKEAAHKYGWVRVNADGDVLEVIDRTNPNAKWDWWSIGGRWAGYFRARSPDAGKAGKPGLFGSLKSKSGVDMLRKRDVDYEAEAAEVSAEAGAYYDRVHAVVAGHLEGFRSWQAIRAEVSDIDEARALYHGQSARQALNEARDSKGDRDLTWAELDDMLCSRDEYIAKRVKSARTPFAFVDKAGQWHERGEMGWFGCARNEKDSWPDDFEREMAKIDDGDWLVAVDCHI